MALISPSQCQISRSTHEWKPLFDGSINMSKQDTTSDKQKGQLCVFAAAVFQLLGYEFRQIIQEKT